MNADVIVDNWCIHTCAQAYLDVLECTGCGDCTAAISGVSYNKGKRKR